MPTVKKNCSNTFEAVLNIYFGVSEILQVQENLPKSEIKQVLWQVNRMLKILA